MNTNIEPRADGFHDALKAVLPQLRRHGMALTHDRSAMEDLVQETVVRALAARRSFQAGTNFAAWVHRILRNEFISGTRKARRTVPLDDVVAERLSVPGTQFDRLVLRELISAIDKLPPVQREALLLSTLSELSYDQIGAVMGCRAGTVKSRISRARCQLQQDLTGIAAGDGRAAPPLHAPRSSDGSNPGDGAAGAFASAA